MLSTIETLLSVKKITFYKEKFGDSWFEVYKAELGQAKEIFVCLHFLEIFLRNKISIELSQDFGNWLFDKKCSLKLNQREQEKITIVIETLNKTGKEISQDNIISNLNFGFWTNLFHKSYNYPIWQNNKILERVFPYLKNHNRNLKQIQKEMEAIRKFRNRIFHFENLQSWNFEEMKELIDKSIYGISGSKIKDILK
ncbi:MAG: hypothetical protein ACJAZX_000077 [Rickettsiales bacterium]|jgi:hypothetical protein